MGLFKKIAGIVSGNTRLAVQTETSQSDNQPFSMDLLQQLINQKTVAWREIREEIHKQMPRAVTTAQRTTLLAIHHTIMSQLETHAAPDKRAELHKLRLQDYRLLLMPECLVGDSISVDDLDRVTAREVAAGRMAEDDELRQLAINGISEPHFTRAQLRAEQGLPAELEQPEISDADMVRVHYALTELAGDFLIPLASWNFSWNGVRVLTNH